MVGIAGGERSPQEKAAEGADEQGGQVQGGHEQQVLFGAAVGPPQGGQPQARSGAQACDAGGEGQAAFQVQLGEEHRGGAVGQKAHQARQQGLEHGAGQQEPGQGLLPHQGDGGAQDQVYQEEEEEDLPRVGEGGPEDALVLAVAVLAQVLEGGARWGR